jgi:hypothetical protein
MRAARLLVGSVVLASAALACLACAVTSIELGGAADDGGFPVLDASVLRDAAAAMDAGQDAGADSATSCSAMSLTSEGDTCNLDLALFDTAESACAMGTAPLSRFVADEACDGGSSRTAMYTCCAFDPKGCGGGTLSGAKGFCSPLTELFASATQGCVDSHGALAGFTTFGCDADAGMAQGASYTCCP